MMNKRCKICRREGKKLFLKGERCNAGKCALVKRNYPPGIHGNKGSKKLTEYGLQLREKQEAKRTYGLSETQFRNYFKKSVKQKGDTVSKMLELLEMRLDNAIYRLGLSRSRKEARQLVTHGFFLVNKKKADIPSINLRVNDIVGIRKMNKGILKDLDKKIDFKKLPSWLSFDLGVNEAKIVGKPELTEVNPHFDLKAIVEYYSR